MTITKTIIADIAGGTKPLVREVGANMTIQHLWSTYRWVPGLRDTINLEVDAIFSNGINEDDKIDPTRVIECKETLRWSLLAGYSAIIVDARDLDNPKCEAWHPAIDGIGFEFTGTSKKGNATQITVHLKANEVVGGDIHYDIPHYPCEKDADGEFINDRPIPGEYGFFNVRTQGNLRGLQGLPLYLHLIDVFKIQWDIMKAYAPFAEKQGMGFPAIFLKNNNQATRKNIKTQFASLPTSNRLLILGFEDAIEYLQPLAGGYDPFPMLTWLNKVLARASQMNKLMLEGEPAGALSSSTTAVNRWETKNNEKQAYWRTQFIGPWKALGGSDECNFKDPGHPTFIDLMEGLKSMREAMDGIIEPEDIVFKMNEYLESNDQKAELHCLSKEELQNINQNNNGGDNNDRKEENTDSKDNG
jgi:hypothetical protein